jgi:hypothetical protein
MEPEDSLSCSQDPATCPYTEPDERSPQRYIIFIRTILILFFPSTPRFTHW